MYGCLGASLRGVESILLIGYPLLVYCLLSSSVVPMPCRLVLIQVNDKRRLREIEREEGIARAKWVRLFLVTSTWSSKHIQFSPSPYCVLTPPQVKEQEEQARKEEAAKNKAKRDNLIQYRLDLQQQIKVLLYR